MKPAILLLLLSLTLPAMAADTNAPAATTLTTGQNASFHAPPPAKLEQDKDASAATPKKHWWSHIKIIGFWTPSKGKGTDGSSDEILRYQDLSSRPWSTISANPGYMSNDMDLRVHHPNFGVGGSY